MRSEAGRWARAVWSKAGEPEKTEEVSQGGERKGEIDKEEGKKNDDKRGAWREEHNI